MVRYKKSQKFKRLQGNAFRPRDTMPSISGSISQKNSTNRKAKQARITDFFNTNDASEPTTEDIEALSRQDITFFQCNNQKRLMAMENIVNIATKTDLFAVLGQEPHSDGINVQGLDKRHVIIQGSEIKPRSYIYAHNSLNTWPIEEFCCAVRM